MPSCPACQTENPARAKFCLECGARLTAAADAAPAPGRSYTPRHLAEKVLRHRAALQGERKRVTVLFADIQGSTRIAEQAGAENWHLILEGFFEILSDAVHRYEGTVNQYTGDGIMALFGAPIAHEDHAQRACLAALAMQRAMQRYAAEMGTRYAVTINMRVGLNSGEVVVGAIGDDLRMDYTAQGLTVNLAQRMESLCAPGGITLTRHTVSQLQDRFRVRALGSKLVHGVSEPVEVFELEGEDAAWPRSTPVALGWAHTRFVGRDRELAALQGAMIRVHESGRGEVFLLSGGAGLGKTRLCREFGQRTLAGGLDFHRCACLPYARAIPLWPIRRLLREKLGIRENSPPADGRGEPTAALPEIERSRSEARRIAEAALAALNSPDAEALRPRWLEFLEATEETPATQTQGLGLRRRLLDLVATALLATRSGQVLLIEDVQSADAATAEFLLRLARAVAGSKTLLLVNFRSDHNVGELRSLSAGGVTLDEFSGEDLQDLSRDWLGENPSVQEVARHVQERTGGNPFFLEEAVRDLEQSGYLKGRRGAYELVKPIGEWHIPDTVHALLAARMDRLPPQQKALLQSAAVVGRRFSLKLLAELTGATLFETVDQVHALEAAGFVRRPGQAAEGEFALSHALMQEVAYHTLLESQRKALHARLAEHMEAQHPQSGPPCEQWIGIAHHWEKAGQWVKAGAWNLAALQWASRWDLNLMLEQVRAAVANLDRAGARPETVEKRIHARSALIRLAAQAQVTSEEIERAYQEGRELAKSSRDLEGHARLVLSYGVHCLHCGDADLAAERAVQAARLVLAGARGAAAEFVAPTLYIHNTAGRLEEGLHLARELAGPEWTSEPMNARSYPARAEAAAALTYLGRLEPARAELDAVLKAAAEDDGTTAWVYAFLVDHAGLSGDVAGVMEHARYALARAEAFGSPQYKAWALRALGAAHCLTRQHAQAVAPLEQARSLFDDGAVGYIFQGVYLATLAEAYRGSGQPQRAAEAAETGIAAARRAHARIQELQAWTVFLALPPGGHWDSRVPFGLARMEELIAATGAVAFLPWWCQCQARWAPDTQSRNHWLRQTLEAFTQVGATLHVKRLAQSSA